MHGDRRDGRVARIYLVAVVDPPGVLTQLRIEERDWMDRLISRLQLSPLTSGGFELTIARGIDRWHQLINEGMALLEASEE